MEVSCGFPFALNFHLLKLVFSPVGFEGNLPLLGKYFSRGLNQMEVKDQGLKSKS